jgi:hypothetical protein
MGVILAIYQGMKGNRSGKAKKIKNRKGGGGGGDIEPTFASQSRNQSNVDWKF